MKCKKIAHGKILVLLKDLSLYRELEKTRVKDRLKTLFFASMAHELLNPINIINGMNEEALALPVTDFLEIKDKLLKNK
jgi:signal transduction histidine kinase